MLGRIGPSHPEVLIVDLQNANYRDRCVFGEMFKGKPILAGTSDLNQAQLIFNLVGSPTEENMPGWSSLPGAEPIRSFGFKRPTLATVFHE